MYVGSYISACVCRYVRTHTQTFISWYGTGYEKVQEYSCANALEVGSPTTYQKVSPKRESQATKESHDTAILHFGTNWDPRKDILPKVKPTN